MAETEPGAGADFSVRSRSGLASVSALGLAPGQWSGCVVTVVCLGWGWVMVAGDAQHLTSVSFPRCPGGVGNPAVSQNKPSSLVVDVGPLVLAGGGDACLSLRCGTKPVLRSVPRPHVFLRAVEPSVPWSNWSKLQTHANCQLPALWSRQGEPAGQDEGPRSGRGRAQAAGRRLGVARPGRASTGSLLRKSVPCHLGVGPGAFPGFPGSKGPGP